MYLNKNPYVLSDTLKMAERCAYCDTKYKIEPSFFFGSMYVSYALGIAFAVAAFLVSYIFLDTGINVSFVSIILTLVVFLPVILRVSRNIWINFFIHFDKESSNK
jgi:hypothetical protein